LEKLSPICLYTNKDNFLNVRNCIISLLSFGQNIFMSKLFQHIMSLTYEHVLNNLTSRVYVDIVQKIVNKGVHINAKSKNEKMLLHLTCGNNCDGVILILFIGLSLSSFFFTTFFLVSKIMNLYKFV
jgi:hypothetical protein